tara:strand:+ start:469 stop:1104 length:636 start_codon:yes stop_codon:yes gene_type:complete
MVEVIMNSRSLASWFLIIGPILCFATFPFWPQMPTASEELIELVKNSQLSLLLMISFATGMTLLFCGLSMASREVAGSDTKNSSLAIPAAILFPIAMAVIAIGIAFNIGALQMYETSPDMAQSVYLIGYYSFEGTGVCLFLSFVLLGTALITGYESMICKIIGALYVVVAIAHFTGLFFTPNSTVDVVGWMGMFIVSILFGIVSLRGQTQE